MFQIEIQKSHGHNNFFCCGWAAHSYHPIVNCSQRRQKSANLYMENKQKIHIQHCRVYSGLSIARLLNDLEMQYMSWSYKTSKKPEEYEMWRRKHTNHFNQDIDTVILSIFKNK